MAKYGYGRVSSKGQEREGNSLEDQEAKFQEIGVPEENIVLETYTGTTMERPKLTALLSKLNPGDELVVTKLDRFARTAAEGGALIKKLVDHGVTVNVLNMGRADNSTMGKLMVTIILAFAEYERDMIVERLNNGKEIEKAKNPDYREGRKPMEVHPRFEEYSDMVAIGGITVKAACEELGISRSTWYKWSKQKVG